MTHLGIPRTDGLEADPRQTAIRQLAELLRGRQYDVTVEASHLTVQDGGRPVQVWAMHRPDDDHRLWFAWPGRMWICRTSHLQDAVVHVKKALRRTPSARGEDPPSSLRGC
ncbi:hypothetical protein [Thermomonospora cellulosilytica]|uniref:Uncharacterized protein n=1 Tax=Thermomonospora cellulosilytica TaxID=1411118 RepID=A0A7W3N474_9ACTN|nr:hypothetical protein [Thermomonospora cellulosilytica]MBA9007254.1 hypothetical protein [Thermomonospora cellulosilytica]